VRFNAASPARGARLAPASRVAPTYFCHESRFSPHRHRRALFARGVDTRRA
jgi:hypothetical protein